MILPDLNLLVYAHHREASVHAAARAWWEERLSATQPVCLSWIVVLGFIRLSTNRAVFREPLSAADACSQVRSWLAQPQVMLLEPGSRHANILFGLLEEIGTAGNLTTDAHLAALAIEHQCELQSTDADFARFSGLRWRNPLRVGNGR
jgi:toxin-antitoxin system PIN domain toxin